MWLDVRTAETVERLKVQTEGRKAETLKALSGLPISTYFSALKLCWLMDNVPEVKVAIEQKRCYFGTVDTWLIWVSLLLYKVIMYILFVVVVFVKS